jgi:hypothetical protein
MRIEPIAEDTAVLAALRHASGPMRGLRRRPSIARWCLVAMALGVVACSGRRAPYPIGATVEFQIVCVQNLWPGPAVALDVREAFCDCLIRRCAQRWDVEQLDQIRLALERGGYRTDAAGVPPELAGLVAECKGAVDRGAAPVD